jgi:hypothetical protein
MKVYVLVSRFDTDLGTPGVYTTHDKAYEAMEAEYQEWVGDGSNENYIYEMGANVYPKSGGYVEWEITECKVE